MLRELFTIPGTSFTIYTYGLMLVLAALGAMQTGKWLGRWFGINADHFVNLTLIALTSGVIGARLSHILENFNHYFGPEGAGIWAALNFRAGGMTYYGGFLAGAGACLVYIIYHKLPIRRLMDVTAPAIMVGLAIGRVGCFANGCCWGGPCELPWAVRYDFDSAAYKESVAKDQITPPAELLVEFEAQSPTGPVRIPAWELHSRELPAGLRVIAQQQHTPHLHPTQVYSTITALLIASVCAAFVTTSSIAGLGFALMLVLEGAGRFVIEMLRVNVVWFDVAGLGVTYSMMIGAMLVVVGLVLAIVFSRMPRSAPLGVSSTQ